MKERFSSAGKRDYIGRGMPVASTAVRQIFLSTLPARSADRRRALAVVLLSLVLFAPLAPFADVALPVAPPFIPIYETALVINDLITTVLLVSQVHLLRSPALLALATGYLFTALMAAAHMLSFPGLFTATGLLGAGGQTTAWLYMFWHTGFPLWVIAYALLKDRTGTIVHVRTAVFAAGVFVVAVVCGVTLLTTAGEGALPAIMQGHLHAPAMKFVVSSVWAVSLAALAVLWVQRPHSVLDMWLFVVLCAWLFDVALSAVLSGGRFDIGFYAGRIYGFLAASFVLLALLLETGSLYVRLAQSLETEREERERRLQETQTLLIHLSRVSEVGLLVPALVHEVNQPLAAITNYLEAVIAFIRGGDAAKAETNVQKAAQQADRASQILRRLRNFVRREEPQKQPERLADVIEEAMTLASIDSRRRGIHCEVRVDPRVTTALIDKVQIQQVLLNLVRNAFEAMADGPRRSLVVAAAPAEGGMVEVSVADTGRGLSEEVRTRLFEPFVTSKASGMGVGLSICRSIIELHGGSLRAADNPGGGMVFYFTVPAGGAPA